MPHLLLLSNSTQTGRDYLEHAEDVVSDFMDGVREVLFVPFALADHAGYTARVAAAFARLDIEVRGLHAEIDATRALVDAPAVFVGGGNTFRLVAALQQRGLIARLRESVRFGTRYLGASAGTNIAAPTLRTTNDMPIVQPRSFETLGLVPFQINPHYVDADPLSRHAGETREQRLTEFLEENDVEVLGLREGTHLHVDGDRATVGGAAGPGAPGPAVRFRRGDPPHEVSGDVSDLLRLRPRFDVGSLSD
jgi:dipeptidase E